MGSLLIAGPTVLEDWPQRRGVIGGQGAYAALAAAALVHTQLWSRRPADFDAQKQQVLEQRRIDCAGFDADGEAGRALPGLEPVSAAGLGAALVTGLARTEEERALAVLDELGKQQDFLRCLQVPSDAHDAASLTAVAARVDLLILPQSEACRILDHSTAAVAEPLLAAGCTAVVLTAGPLGGLLAYKQKRCTWPSLALPSPDHHGRGAIFAGVLAGLLAEQGQLDWRGLKRHLATASAVAGQAGTGVGPIKLLGMDRAAYQTQFLRQRRNGKS